MAGLPWRITTELRRLVQVDDLNTGIATFYDESSGLWEEMWGEWRIYAQQADP
jgi:hypothetical protein